MLCAGTCGGQGLPSPHCGHSFLLSRFWLLRRKETFQGKSEPRYSRNSKEAEFLELREGCQRDDGESGGVKFKASAWIVGIFIFTY